jgi:hypothetical protein
LIVAAVEAQVKTSKKPRSPVKSSPSSKNSLLPLSKKKSTPTPTPTSSSSSSSATTLLKSNVKTYDDKYKFDINLPASERAYLMEADSYRHLLCRFCFQYDCNLHEDFGSHAAPAPLQLQTQHALLSQPALSTLLPAPLPDVTSKLVVSSSTSLKGSRSTMHSAPWLPKDMSGRVKGLFQRLYTVFEGDLESIAVSMHITISEAK